ncbi:glycosyltransferase family 2 protein [Oscillatoria salina]|uniref:glycosyltransferase family 2 protein n=1 Tax=Oscillatoria salina TaxID=331517 RepID=UPI0013BB8CB6|nr:glycosyltransferase family A protein [Oscillatoria salina]MBZ8179101.1 glycosyltransferase family 2 protein [Oscillatoria salina IIICB1]NET91587.1 glycosyltransferase family 2 protein [Kamptonema sp. SIO1D9]
MDTNPLVSILINNYNYERFLGEAINSALNQTYFNCEVIVVDDGSTDNSPAIIASYGKQIIPILKKNGGQASAINAGFAASKGEIICLLDSDDLFLPTKVAEVVKILSNQPDLGWCFHPQNLVNTDELELEKEMPFEGKQISASREYDLRIPIRRGKINGYLPPWGIPATSGLCFRRSLLEKILPMPGGEKVSLSDNYIKFAALGLAKGFALAKELSLQRIHNNNIYTYRKDREKEKVRAKIYILTAYWLRINFPSITKFANNSFTTGLSLYQSTNSNDAECQVVIEKYLSLLSLPEKVENNLRLFYYRLKTW